MSLIDIIDRRKHWWKVFAFICLVSVAVVGYVGVKTYTYAPPICDFVAEGGEVVFTAGDITAGQQVFFSRGLMEYGSFLGDGALRGPDFTAEALHRTAQAMIAYYDVPWRDRIPDERTRRTVVQSLVQREIKENRHRDGVVVLTPGQVHAFRELVAYYGEKFGAGGPRAGIEAFQPANYIADAGKIRQLSAFFSGAAGSAGPSAPIIPTATRTTGPLIRSPATRRTAGSSCGALSGRWS
jgi:nitric oxide reductase subunit B